MLKRPRNLALAILTVLCCFGGRVQARKRRQGHPASRSVRVLNHSGFKIDLFWIHPETKELAPSNTDDEGIMYGGETGISSYVGHNFEVQEMPNPKTNKCREVKCKKTYFSVNDNEDQWVTIGKNFEEITIEDNKSRALKKAQEALQGCKIASLDETKTPEQQVDELTECLARGIQSKIDETNDEIEFQASVRKEIGQRLKSYVCDADYQIPNTVNVTTTESVRNVSWGYYNDKKEKVDHPMYVLFETAHSSVRLVKNFMEKSHCDDIIQYAERAKPDTTVETIIGETSVKLPRKLLIKNKSVNEAMKKINSLASAAFGVDNKYYAQRDPMVDVRFLSEWSGHRENKECTIDSDGSCIQDSEKLPENVVRVSQANETQRASLIVICHAPTNDQSDTSDLAARNSGLMFFPKAGVKILPKEIEGDAILIYHEDFQTHERDPDPFLDEYITCPVFPAKSSTTGGGGKKNILVTIEDFFE